MHKSIHDIGPAQARLSARYNLMTLIADRKMTMSTLKRLHFELHGFAHTKTAWTDRLLSPQRIGNFVLLALALAGQASVAHAAGDIVAGKSTFAQCASCHAVGPSAHAGYGPHLTGIFGRPAGSTSDYKYSVAMKNSGIVWTEKTLTAFIKTPSDVVPGTKMRFYGIGDEKKIANLLAYLHTVQ